MHRRKIKGKKFGRETGSRRALYRSLATSVILYEKVNTTKVKAKEVQSIVEKLITTAKNGSLADLRRLDGYLLEKNAAKKLMQELVGLYKGRKGGYTRVINLGPREGDDTPMARIELLDTEKLLGKRKKKEEKSKETEEKEDDKLKNKKSQSRADEPLAQNLKNLSRVGRRTTKKSKV